MTALQRLGSFKCIVRGRTVTSRIAGEALAEHSQLAYRGPGEPTAMNKIAARGCMLPSLRYPESLVSQPRGTECLEAYIFDM
nr:hypothetical protein CFP56_78691 [Quercus suber]